MYLEMYVGNVPRIVPRKCTNKKKVVTPSPLCLQIEDVSFHQSFGQRTWFDMLLMIQVGGTWQKTLENELFLNLMFWEIFFSALYCFIHASSNDLFERVTVIFQDIISSADITMLHVKSIFFNEIYVQLLCFKTIFSAVLLFLSYYDTLHYDEGVNCNIWKPYFL